VNTGGLPPPGGSLFTEGQLTDTYEVSRPTPREALRSLEAQNLVTVRRGSHRGPVVSLLRRRGREHGLSQPVGRP
jgi:DNA-binding FadR family transcriptional regulator